MDAKCGAVSLDAAFLADSLPFVREDAYPRALSVTSDDTAISAAPSSRSASPTDGAAGCSIVVSCKAPDFGPNLTLTELDAHILTLLRSTKDRSSAIMHQLEMLLRYPRESSGLGSFVPVVTGTG